MDEIKLGYIFGQGICQNQNTVRVISHFDELANYGSTSSSLMMLSRKKNQWHHYNLGWKAIRIACSDANLFALGESGELLRAGAAGVVTETIEGSTGELRDMCLIGDHIYVSGCNGQFKKRMAANEWVDCIEGLENKGELSFNRVHGLDESDIYAVGDMGIIHRCVDGVWQEISSPTKANLANVKVIRKGEAYATSEDGVLIHIQEKSAQIVTEDDSLKTLYGIAEFKGNLFFATEDSILKMGSDQTLEVIPIAPGPTWTFGRLNVGDGMLWSFGKNHIFHTEDGKHWHDSTPRTTYFDPAESGPAASQSSSCGCSGGAHKC